jgi:hypothetical protein
VQLYWKFYLVKYHRTDLLDRARSLDLKTLDVGAIQSRSLILTLVADPATPRIAASTAVNKVADITEPDGASSFMIFER